MSTLKRTKQLMPKVQFLQTLNGFVVRLKTDFLKHKLTFQKSMFKSHINLFSCIIIMIITQKG